MVQTAVAAMPLLFLTLLPRQQQELEGRLRHRNSEHETILEQAEEEMNTLREQVTTLKQQLRQQLFEAKLEVVFLQGVTLVTRGFNFAFEPLPPQAKRLVSTPASQPSSTASEEYFATIPRASSESSLVESVSDLALGDPIKQSSTSFWSAGEMSSSSPAEVSMEKGIHPSSLPFFYRFSISFLFSGLISFFPASALGDNGRNGGPQPCSPARRG